MHNFNYRLFLLYIFFISFYTLNNAAENRQPPGLFDFLRDGRPPVARRLFETSDRGQPDDVSDEEVATAAGAVTPRRAVPAGLQLPPALRPASSPEVENQGFEAPAARRRRVEPAGQIVEAGGGLPRRQQVGFAPEVQRSINGAYDYLYSACGVICPSLQRSLSGQACKCMPCTLAGIMQMSTKLNADHRALQDMFSRGGIVVGPARGIEGSGGASEDHE